MRQIITGYWDGEPISRPETAEEYLVSVLNQKQKERELKQEAQRLASNIN